MERATMYMAEVHLGALNRLPDKARPGDFYPIASFTQLLPLEGAIKRVALGLADFETARTRRSALDYLPFTVWSMEACYVDVFAVSYELGGWKKTKLHPAEVWELAI